MAKLSGKKIHDYTTIILFLLPSLVIFGVFVYYALGYNVYLSSTSWNFLTPNKTNVGIRNYAKLIGNPTFWKVTWNTVYYAVGSVSLSLAAGLLLAMLLRLSIPLNGVFRTIFFSPYVTTMAVMALLWVWIYEPSYGVINYALGLLGIKGPHWLTDPNWAMPALILMNVWKQSGYVMILYLAGLTNIDKSLYEAAMIDGAGKVRQFWMITLPLLTPTTFFIVVTSLLNAFKEFDQVAVMTSGGPANATNNLSYYIYEQAFRFFKAGPAAATAVVFFFILFLLTMVQTKFQHKWVHYQ